ncbi:hypothetical protein Pfo_014964 [Paulownia fortunei]|nr:hypothetical protein Pfo_014964 [Paulownia fortunei]
MTRHPKKNIKASNSIETIPHELVAEVLGRVAASSLTDMFNAKLSCKRLNEIAEDTYVYQCVSLDKFPIIPWNPLNEKQEIFLNRCRQYGNPELMYRQAVLDYFNRTNIESTCKNLQKALKLGHMGALYVTCIILLFSGDDELKKKGIKMIGNMKKSKYLKKKLKLCRSKLINTLRQIWVNNPILKEPPVCCTTRHQHQRKSGWLGEEENVTCEACSADIEVKFICNK